MRPGDVMVLIGRGPLGCGMEETYQVTAALKHLSWGKEVALVTDARFSGVSTGACIGHVGPEALAGGPIGRVRDGDRIRIVVDCVGLQGTLDLVGHDGVACTPEGGVSCWHRAARTLTLRLTLNCLKTRGCGRPYSRSAVARGGDASTMWRRL